MSRFKCALVLLVTGLLALGQPVSLVKAADPPEPTVIESDERGLTLTWQLPDVVMSDIQLNQEQYSRLMMTGLPTIGGQPGYPELPIYTRLIGLPPEGGVELRIVDVVETQRPLAEPVIPAAVPQAIDVPLDGSQALPTAGPSERIPNTEIYGQNAFYPAAVATLDSPERLRNQRIARLKINPVRINPITNEMIVVQSLRLEIRFEQPASVVAQASSTGQAASVFDSVLSAKLLNPEAQTWTKADSPNGASELSKSLQNRPAIISGPATKITVSEAGLYAITYEALAAASLPIGSINPSTVQLFHGPNSDEVALQFEGNGNAVFEPDERFLFYAAYPFSRYTDEDAYLLQYGVASGLRMAARSGAPGGLPGGNAWVTVAAEQNTVYFSTFAGRDGDRWFWDSLKQPNDTSGVYPISLPSSPSGNGVLKVWLQGTTDVFQPAGADHRVWFAMNGGFVGEQSWDGKQSIEATFNSVAVNAGVNNVGLSLPGINNILVEETLLDAIAVTYPTTSALLTQMKFTGESGQKAYTVTGWSTPLNVYDITDSVQPRRVTGFGLSSGTLTVGDADVGTAEYLVVPTTQIKSPASIAAAKTLNDPVGGADYIIITYPNFGGVIAPLANHRSNQGLRVVTVNVESIYDTYGGGRFSPEAIQAFLQHAYDTWTPPAPSYVLLVGDGNFDFKNHLGWNAAQYIPPFLADVDPWLKETASDNQYVTVSGSDQIPDMLIGRLAVRTAAEVTTVINKIIQYESSPAPGAWNGVHLMVTDNPDAAGDFHLESDRIYDQLGPDLWSNRLYLGNGTGNAPPHIYDYPNSAQLRDRVLSTFNNGVGTVMYHGHSSWHQWAAEELFRWNQNPALNEVWKLNNGNRLPVVVQMTCFTGFFHHPEYDTMDESLLKQPNGGAVGVWGSTGLGVETGHKFLQEGFYQSFINQSDTTLGAATLNGLLTLNASGFSPDLLDTFMLFGDPALRLHTTVPLLPNDIYLPIIGR